MPEITISAEKELLLAIGGILQEDTTASRRTLAGTLERYKREIAISAEEDKWGTWLEGAMDAISEAVAVWSTQVTFVDVTINSLIAVGQPGTLDGPSLNPQLSSLMVTREVPENIAEKLSNVIANLWEDWQSKVVIPGLPWYPSFMAYPGPLAPPTPNIPTPLIALGSSGMASVTSDQVILEKLGAELGSLANTEGAVNNLEHFSLSFSIRFLNWSTTTMVQNVIGQGPIPIYAPPYVNAGPVVMGNVISAPGVLIGPRF
ncbi:MAG: hypothetical protein IMY83_03515 [Chloroflexi bacterium]|nr:hypothetical protein [Chloroflexota bacterium]